MKKIDEQIKWFQENANNYYDDMVVIELEKINKLYDLNEEHTDEMFVEEMIDSLCKIVQRQREKMQDLQDKIDYFDCSTRNEQPEQKDYKEGFESDEQLVDVFTQYCANKGISSYTSNDYCSRIRKTWKTFEQEYKDGALSDRFSPRYPEVLFDGVLLNAYDCSDVLIDYVYAKLIETNNHRNWQNARAALNKFEEFKRTINRGEKI